MPIRRTVEAQSQADRAAAELFGVRLAWALVPSLRRWLEPRILGIEPTWHPAVEEARDAVENIGSCVGQGEMPWAMNAFECGNGGTKGNSETGRRHRLMAALPGHPMQLADGIQQPLDEASGFGRRGRKLVQCTYCLGLVFQQGFQHFLGDLWTLLQYRRE